MGYTPENNPYIPGDPYSYDLKWIVSQLKAQSSALSTLDQNIKAAVLEALNGYMPVYYAAAADLQASSQAAGTLAIIEGFYTPGDGGSNLYYITDDLSLIMAAPFYLDMDSSNLWAIPIILHSYVNPVMFGAKGDGIVDDTEAIRKALEIGKNVHFTNGTYNIAFADSITEKQIIFELKSDHHLVFDESAVLNITGTAFANLSAVFGATVLPVSNIKLSGGTIQYNDILAVLPQGIRFEAPSDAAADQFTDIIIENMTFRNLGSAVYMVQRSTAGTTDRQVSNVLIKNCKAYKCLGSFVTADGKNITITNCMADGGNEAAAYDAISIHSGIGIKVCDNYFTGYTIGQVINIRNSSENKCGSKDLLIRGNTLVDCATTAIQLSLVSGETAYGCVEATVTDNRIINCATALKITCGSAGSGTPFGNFTVSNNIIKDCNEAASCRSNTTVWNKAITLTGNVITNSGNFDLYCWRECVIADNYIALKTGGAITLGYIYYTAVTGNTFYPDNTGVTFANLTNAVITGNMFKGVVTLPSTASSVFADNACMNNLTIAGSANINPAATYIKGILINRGNNYPTTPGYTHALGDVVINTDTSNDIYGWVCTAAGAPGTWKAIALS